MITRVGSAVAGQYGAALGMLRVCLEQADEAAWQAPVGTRPFWHVAYHALYITDFYLSPDEKTFRPPSFHREDYDVLGSQPWAPHRKVVADRPYDKDTLKTYVDACRAKAKLTMDGETETSLDGASGFSWLKFSRLELHLYNIRHLQHHTGQLGACLRRQHSAGVGWLLSEPL